MRPRSVWMTIALLLLGLAFVAGVFVVAKGSSLVPQASNPISPAVSGTSTNLAASTEANFELPTATIGASTAAVVASPDEGVASPTVTEIGYNRPTRTPGAASPGPAPTLFDNPALILTVVPQPTEPLTPVPLAGLNGQVELPVVQLQRIVQNAGTLVMAEVDNTTDEPLQNIHLIFTASTGERIGDEVSLNFDLMPGESKPGISDQLANDGLIFQKWGTLTAHAVGSPPSSREGQTGYPVSLTTNYPTVSIASTTLNFEATIANLTGYSAAISNQTVAFYANNGMLLFVWSAGGHGTLGNGASYLLSGSIPLAQPVIEGFQLSQFSDVLVNVDAEVAP